MLSRTYFELDPAEQKALIEAACDSPPEEVAADSVQAETWGDDKVLVTWKGARIVPRVQLEAIVRAVAGEQNIPGQPNRSE